MIRVSVWAAGKDASLDPRQARAPPALWRIETGWKRRPQWIPKKPHSARPWEAQVALWPVLLCSPAPSVLFFTLGWEYAEVCGFLRDLLETVRRTRQGVRLFRRQLHQKWRGSDLAQDALAASNSPHQQKHKRTSAIIRFKSCLQWMGKSKLSHCTLMEESGG